MSDTLTQIEHELREALDDVIMHEAPEPFDPEDDHDLDRLGFEVPEWIEQTQPITSLDVPAIAYGGCMSGAYMPAVTYHTALGVMYRWGGEIMDYLDDSGLMECVDMNQVLAENGSWANLAGWFFSAAVELYCQSIEESLDEVLSYEQESAWLDVTIGARVVDGKITEWAIQTGDNSFTGPVYGCPIWGVASVNRDSDPDQVLAEILGQIYEQAAA